ncbi:MAG: response regulator [Lachnospiraceae bacterium]|nr:response regulator [Lachnospiraceae bacterium]
MYHLIIADDEDKICEGIANLFPWEQIGFQVIGQFYNGQDVLKFLEEKASLVDVVLCDIRMPGMDGLEVCRRIAAWPNIRIVLFSSHKNYEYFRKALQYRITDYLLKPINYKDLTQCFEKIREELDKECGNSRNFSDACESALLPGGSSRLTDEVIQYLNENFQDASLEKAAAYVGLSPSYLSRLFKEKSGIGFSDLLLKTRMEKAAAMLSDIRYKSYEIAHRVGYDNPKNFSRAFKAYYGVSPSEYRRENTRANIVTTVSAATDGNADPYTRTSREPGGTKP